MRLEGAIGTTLTGLALAAVFCLHTAAQSPPAQGPSEAAPVQQPLEQSPAPPAVGGIASYVGLIVQKIDFPDLPSANTTRLLDLIPQDRTGSEDARFELRRGEHATGLEDLRGLLPAIRAAGEKGLKITRFKGLGEMNAEELRDTTLDPRHRTLLKVTMDDANAADDLFRILMGDKVEPRREFIEKHALEVRNLDV